MSKYINANFVNEYGLDEFIKCICCGKGEHGGCDGGCDIEARKYGERAYEALVSWVQDVPDADVVEVRHGRWKRVRAAYGGYDAVCSACNCDIWTESEWEEMDAEYQKYCPYCGARMDGVE